MARLRRWWALPPGERGLLLQLIAGLLLVNTLLHFFGYVKTRTLLDRWVGHRSTRLPTGEELQAAERMAALAAIAGRRGLLAATCLRQALLVHWLLRRRGLEPELKLGVRKLDGNFDAHAWVELGGVALAQASVQHQPFSH